MAVYLSQFSIVCKNVWLSGTSYYTKYKPTSLVVLVLYCMYTLCGLVVSPTILSTNLQSSCTSSLLSVHNVWLSGTSYYNNYKLTSLVVLIIYCQYTMYGPVVRSTIPTTDLLVNLPQFSTACKNVWLSSSPDYTKYRPGSLFDLVLYCLYTMYSSVVRSSILSTNLLVQLLQFLYWLYTMYCSVIRPTELSINLLVQFTMHGSALRLTILSIDLVIQLFLFSIACKNG